MSTLHIQLLGEFRLSDGAEQLIIIDQPRQRALLAYLLLHHHAPQPRRQLAFLFWPDTTEAQAHTNLRQLLYHLRRAWPAVGDFVQIEAHTLQWRLGPDDKLDIATFTRALTQAMEAIRLSQLSVARTAFTAAVDQYAGDLLPACYDEWLLTERERLRQCFLDAVEQLVLLCEDQRDYASAIHYAQRLLRADPLHETTYRRLMRLYALNHDRAGALRTYHICTVMLARELGVEPHDETQEAYARLLNLETPPVLRPRSAILSTGSERLIGRQAAWAKLQAAWQIAVRGRAHVVCISGEAGIGKTRLAEELLNWARHQGIAQARTRSYAAEGSLAYAPITEWLRAEALQPGRKQLADLWLSEAARLLPELLTERPTLPRPEPLTERWQRQRFFEALARLIVAANQPLLLLLDDLQWCDQETLEWLPYLLRYDPHVRLLLVGTVRLEEITEQHPLLALLHHLRGTGQITEIELDPFTVEETTALAGQIAAHPIDPATAQHLYRDTEGNPLFIVETVRAELNRQEDSRNSTFSLSSSLRVFPSSLPPTIYHVIQQRLAQLSPLARDLSGLAATIGRSFAFDLLAAASEQAEDAVVRGLDELWQRRVVRVQGGNAYDFSHDRLREVAYSQISPVRRPLLHRRVAQALERLCHDQLDLVCGQLAFHCEQAGLVQKAVTYYRQAATTAHHLLAYPEMETYLNKGLALLDTLSATPEHLQQKLDMLLHLGSVLMIVKGFTAPEVEKFLNQARALCDSVGENQTRFAVLQSLRTYWVKHCRWDIAAKLDEELLALAHETQDPVHRQTALRNSGGMAFHRGRLQEAYTHFEHAIELFDFNQRLSKIHDHEQDQGIANLRYSMGTLWLLGYPDQAQARMKEMLRRTRKLARPFDLLISLDFAMDLEHRLRRPQVVQELAAEYSALNANHQFPYCISYEMVFRGWSLCKQGEADKGLAVLHQGIDLLYEMQVFLFWPQVLTLQIEAYGLTKRYAEGVSLINKTLDFVNKTGELYWNAEFHRCKGEFLLAMQGEAKKIEECFQQALTISYQQGAKSLELRAAISLARLWQTQGKQIAARTLLAEIYNWFTEGFDTADLQEARALLTKLDHTFA